MEKIDRKVVAIIVDKLGVEEADVKLGSNFQTDLLADSLDAVELIIEAENDFGISIDDSEIQNVNTVLDAVLLLESKTGEKLHTSDSLPISSIGMSQLERDLRNLADDALTKEDAEAAFKLLAEILGAGAVIYIAANVIGALFGPSGFIAVSHGTLVMLLKKCGDVYADLPTDQRTLIRKLARGVKGLI